MLNANATPESHIRLKHAQDIANACPQFLFDEIALTGSSARGIATDSSDIEINFWVESLPDLQARLEWIRSLGVEQITAHHEPRPDLSYWINGTYKGIELECGWQSFDNLSIALSQLMSAQITDHKALRLAELVLSAKHLRGSNLLAQWQDILKSYPSELSHNLVADALTNWLSDNWCDNRLQSNNLKDDIHRVWRLIFALNHHWEINWKYAHHSLDSLEFYPNDMAQRIWEIQQLETESAINPMLELILETLELIKTNMGDSDLLSINISQCQSLILATKN